MRTLIPVWEPVSNLTFNGEAIYREVLCCDGEEHGGCDGCGLTQACDPESATMLADTQWRTLSELPEHAIVSE